MLKRSGSREFKGRRLAGPRRFQRGEAEHKALPTIDRADFGCTVFDNHINEMVEFVYVCLAIAIDEEVHGRVLTNGVSAIALDVARRQHALRAEHLNALVIAIDGPAAYIDVAPLAVFRIAIAGSGSRSGFSSAPIMLLAVA